MHAINTILHNKSYKQIKLLTIVSLWLYYQDDRWGVVQPWSTYMLKTFKSLLNDECGATAVEYALVIGLVSIAIITAAQNLGGSISSAFGTIQGQLDFVVAK